MLQSQSEQAPSAALIAPVLHRTPQSWLFLVITIPYGMVTGAITGTLLSFLLRREGVAVGSIANELALLSFPATFFFLWSPLSDFWLRRRTWLIGASAIASIGVAAAFYLPSSASPAAVALLLAATCASLFSNASYGGLVAALVPGEMKVRVSSLHQVGNLGGGALGAGGLILLAQHVSTSTMGLVAAVLSFLPALAALLIDEPPVDTAPGESFRSRIGAMGAEFKTTFLRWSALPALLLLLSPLGSGGAVGLLPGIAPDYGVSGNQVAWLNGMAGSLLTAAGALLAALVPGRVDTRLSYAVLGLVNAVTIGILCIGPIRPLTYLVGTVLYLLTVGACWAVFTALVLQVIGNAGRSGCCRYAIALSLGNAPVAYMAWLDGRGANWFGIRGLSGMDAVVSGVASVGFLLWLWWRRSQGNKLPEIHTPADAAS